MRQPLSFRFSSADLVVAFFLLLVGCEDKRMETEISYGEVYGDIQGIPVGNALGGLPGPVYASQADSPIHWQPWTKASLQMAHNSKRLVLAVIAMPQQPQFLDILNELYADAASVELINSTYVPILIDGDAVREYGMLSSEWCAEAGRDLQLPLMVLMTAEGNPVAWLPMPAKEFFSMPELLAQSHVMVSRIWVDDADYIMTQSRLDQVSRRARMLGAYTVVFGLGEIGRAHV